MNKKFKLNNKNKINKRFFMSYVATCKLQQILAGKSSSVNSKQLFLQAIKENINCKEYEHWIQSKVNQ